MAISKHYRMKIDSTKLKSSPITDLKPEEILQDIGNITNVAWGLGRTAIIVSALELGIFDYISNGCEDTKSIAEASNASIQGIKLLLDSLADLNFIHKTGDDHYLLSVQTSNYLTKNSPLYIGDMWRVHKYLNWNVWNQLSESIKTGKPIKNLFSFHENELWETILPYLDSLARPVALYIIDLLNLSDKKEKFSILDVGCGSGIYGQTFAKSNPNVEILGVDQENVLRMARSKAFELQVDKQLKYMSGDFNEVKFGKEFDAVLFSNIFHGFNQNNNIQLMNKAFSSLKPGGSIIINEFMNDKKTVDKETNVPSILSLHFHLVGQGQVYSYPTYESWLTSCGFSDVKLFPLSGQSSIILAKKI